MSDATQAETKRFVPASEVKSITGDIRHAFEQGRMFTDARSALIAYAVLVLELKQTDIATETGVDKGDISRVVKSAKGNDEAVKALQGLKRAGVDRPTRMTDAAAIGAAYLRRERKAPVTPADKTETTEGEATTAPVKSAAPQSVADLIQSYSESVYEVALGMGDEDRKRFEVAITEALRNANIAANKQKSGKAVPAPAKAAA